MVDSKASLSVSDATRRTVAQSAAMGFVAVSAMIAKC